jgi:hypothetical protein
MLTVLQCFLLNCHGHGCADRTNLYGADEALTDDIHGNLNPASGQN